VPSGTRADSTRGTDANSEISERELEIGAGHSLATDLWSSRISALDSREDAETRLALKRLIRQVQSITLNDKVAARSPTEPEPVGEPPVSTVPTTVKAEPAPPETVVATAPETTPALSATAQKTLADLQRDPSRVRDPLEAAELLFLSGRPTAAVPFYEEALRRTPAGPAAERPFGPGAAAAGDRAWILFQLGNCLRETDAAKAQAAYTQLIAEYPSSPWTEMAQAGGRLLTWYQSTRPDQLIKPAPTVASGGQ
jgi:tetratricopeptide (TPR) repeat protein